MANDNVGNNNNHVICSGVMCTPYCMLCVCVCSSAKPLCRRNRNTGNDSNSNGIFITRSIYRYRDIFSFKDLHHTPYIFFLLGATFSEHFFFLIRIVAPRTRLTKQFVQLTKGINRFDLAIFNRAHNCSWQTSFSFNLILFSFLLLLHLFGIHCPLGRHCTKVGHSRFAICPRANQFNISIDDCAVGSWAYTSQHRLFNGKIIIVWRQFSSRGFILFASIHQLRFESNQFIG